MNILFENFGVQGCYLSPPRPMHYIHHHHEVELNFVFKGKVTYLYKGSLKSIEQENFALFWGSVPHYILDVEPQSEMAWITVPISSILNWGLPSSFIHHILQGEWYFPPPRSLSRFPAADWIKEMSGKGQNQDPGLLSELKGLFFWLASRARISPQNQALKEKKNASEGLQYLEKMSRYMAEHYLENISIDAIAKAAGLHPHYALTFFRQRSGITLKAYLIQLRVMHAQQLLLTNNKKVTEIAFESGFGTLSSFYDAFERRVGMTPREFRLQMVKN